MGAKFHFRAIPLIRFASMLWRHCWHLAFGSTFMVCYFCRLIAQSDKGYYHPPGTEATRGRGHWRKFYCARTDVCVFWCAVWIDYIDALPSDVRRLDLLWTTWVDRWWLQAILELEKKHRQ